MNDEIERVLRNDYWEEPRVVLPINEMSITTLVNKVILRNAKCQIKQITTDEMFAGRMKHTVEFSSGKIIHLISEKLYPRTNNESLRIEIIFNV